METGNWWVKSGLLEICPEYDYTITWLFNNIGTYWN